jgi:regulatory protein
MRAYLERFSSDPDAIERLLHDLASRGWLSEDRLAEQVIRSRRARGSAQRTRQEMSRRGISEDVIAQSTAGLDDGDLSVAKRLLRKRFRLPAVDQAERERQLRFLVNRGFNRAIGLKAVRAGADDDASESVD